MSTCSANETDETTERNMSESNSTMLKELDSRSIQRVYLITYSQADMRFSLRSMAYLRQLSSGVVAKRNTNHLVGSITTWL
jgi:hypothetical protein